MIYNYFIITSLSTILEINLNLYIIISLVIILAAIRIIPISIERNKSHRITEILVEISGLWLWASFMYLFEIILLYIIGFFIQLSLTIKTIIVLLVPLFMIIGYYVAHHNYIRGYEIYLKEKSEKPSKPVTIIHVSDIHIGSMIHKSTITELVNNINKIAEEKQKENTKVITIISGDVADGSSPILPDTFMGFKDAIMPVIFTPGNHDYYQGIDHVKKALENAGVIILDDDNLIYDDVNLNIIGLRFSFDNLDLDNSYKLPISDTMNNILIYHVPQYWDEFSKMGIELQLSGHTHGGQFFPVNYVSKLMFEYSNGLFNRQVTVKDKTYRSYLSVTDGVGAFAAPIRLGTHSEIVVLNINRVPGNRREY